MSSTEQSSQFIQMTDEEAAYQQEVEKLEKRGKRLRRAALTAGIFALISIVCTIYTTISVRWLLIEPQQPERTAYQITESMAAFKFGIVGDSLVVVSDTLVGALIGLILIGAGVNPATSSILVVFKVLQQALNGANILFMIAAGLLLDERLPIYDVIAKYFYSDNMPPIGTQISYLFLMLNQYGHYFAQSKLPRMPEASFESTEKLLVACYFFRIRSAQFPFHLVSFASLCRSLLWNAWIHYHFVGCLPSLDGIRHVRVRSLLHC